MLTRPAELPRGSADAFEVKWDGFRAIVSTVDRLIVRSRRGWDMTHAVRELERLPAGLILDGELIALGDDGLPSFPRLAERVLHGRDGIPRPQPEHDHRPLHPRGAGSVPRRRREGR
jgi:bifunctional non-homologous end joining protein LigD